MGLRSDGSVTCWGDNWAGQATPPGGSFTQVSAGGGHSCGLRSDGSVICWGINPVFFACGWWGRFPARVGEVRVWFCGCSGWACG